MMKCDMEKNQEKHNDRVLENVGGFQQVSSGRSHYPPNLKWLQRTGI